jgi:hypothetical protein
MKVGDLVRKWEGQSWLKDVGVIVKITKSGIGTTSVSVLHGGIIKSWNKHLVEVIDEKG